MMHLLERAGYRTLELGKHSLALENINSTVDYRTLETGPRPFVLLSAAGKTAEKPLMITRLVPELVRRGYKVAVIKHDGHDFESDVPGTDSYRHQKAGAYGTAVFSDHRFLITKEYQGITERELFAAFPEADIILIEGLKNSPYPKYFCRYPEQPLISAEKLADEIEKYICTYSPGNSTDSVKTGATGKSEIESAAGILRFVKMANYIFVYTNLHRICENNEESTKFTSFAKKYTKNNTEKPLLLKKYGILIPDRRRKLLCKKLYKTELKPQTKKSVHVEEDKPMAKKWVYLFTEGDATMRNLLGGKGANLAEMTNIGLPVPQGFTITTEACTQYYEDGREINDEIQGQINEYIAKMEEITGKKFGDLENPLLVSVRSGARASMPGMMDTILNLGLNEAVVNVIAEKSNNPRWAWTATEDSFRCIPTL